MFNFTTPRHTDDCYILNSLNNSNLMVISVPRAIPMNVQVDPGSVKATIADIDWTHVDTSPEEVRGFFKGYKVRWQSL